MNIIPIDQEALFQRYPTATAFAQAHNGVQPPYNAALGIKDWEDTSANPNSSAIKTYNVAGPSGIIQFQIPEASAAVCNLPPDPITYPTYVVASTAATRGSATINPVYLSMEVDARSLMADLGGTGLAIEDLSGFPMSYPVDEPRRLYYFLLSGHPLNVGNLLYAKNFPGGIGAPGHWDVSSGSPTWVATPAAPMEANTQPRFPMPLKPLTATQSTVQQLMGGFLIEDNAGQPAPLSAGGSFTDADRQLLTKIAAALSVA